MGEPDCSRLSERPPTSVPPLSSFDRNGERYKRRADVEAIIVDMLGVPVQEWTEAARKSGDGSLPSEALVFLIRTIKDRDLNVVGTLVDVLTRRIVRIARRWARGFDAAETQEITLEVQDQIFEHLFATTPSRQSEFLEVAFYEAVKNFTLNLVSKVHNKPELVIVNDRRSEEDDEPQYVADSLPERGQGPEQLLVQLADEQKRRFLVSKALAAVKDRRHVQAVILRHVHGWPITDKDPNNPSLTKLFGKSEKQIRNWIKGALAAMRTAIGDSQ
jgi:hypothetical protein